MVETKSELGVQSEITFFLKRHGIETDPKLWAACFDSTASFADALLIVKKRNKNAFIEDIPLMLERGLKLK